MKRRGENPDEEWFARLDAITTEKETPTPQDDELLHVAAKLTDALSPLNSSDALPMQNFRSIQVSTQAPATMQARRKKRSLLQTLLTTAAVLFALFGIVGACPANTSVVAATRDAGQRIWQAATSFEQIDASSLALLAAKRAGVRPLLPVTVPANTQSVEFGIVTEDTSPQAFRAFIADYSIAGQDVSIYEESTNLVVPSSAAQNITVGLSEGHLFQDNAGNSILQWYQDDMTCQIASTLPIDMLLALARQFHPIARWDLIL